MALSPCGTVTDIKGRELMEHGTLLFPIGFYHDDLQEREVPWHWHEELEAAVITEGQALVAIGTKRYVLKQGEGFFVNTGVLHGAWAQGDGPCRFHSMAFQARLIAGGMDSIFWQKYLQPLLSDHSLKGVFFYQEEAWQQEAMSWIEEAWQRGVYEGPGFEFQVRHAMSELTLLLYGHRALAGNRPSEKSIRDGERMKQMLQYMQDHYMEEISTSQVAGSALISVSECLRCFRSMINATPIAYLKQLRVQKAAELLTSTDWKVAEIGYKCGFQEMSYFAKSFREIKGCTPSEYRKRKLEKGREKGQDAGEEQDL